MVAKLLRELPARVAAAELLVEKGSVLVWPDAQVVEQAARRWAEDVRRAARWDATRLPVPTDVLVYTRAEWERLSARPREVVWVRGSPS